MWRPFSTPTGAIGAPRSRVSGAALSLAASLCLLAAASPSPVPSASRIIQLHQRAMRPDAAVPAPASTELLGYVEGNGLFGTFRQYRQGAGTRSEVRLGPLDLVTVGDGKRLWESDQNGSVRELTGVLRARALTSDFIAGGGYLNDPATLTYLGVEASEGRPCYRFAVQAPRGDRQWICIDARTYLLDRQEFVEGQGIASVDFSEYRTVDGSAVAYRWVQRDAGSPGGVVFTVDDVIDGRALDPTLFERPPPRYVELAAPRAVVSLRRTPVGYEAPVEIAGRRFWFLLDSGSQGIIVDAAVADALGLHGRGSLSAVGAGVVGGLAVARVAALSVGGATLRDVTVGILDLSQATGGALVADGVLGFPFFDAAVLRFDPRAATLEIASPTDADLTADGERLTVQLDRRVPVVEAGFAGGGTAPFVIDTGSSAELLLYPDFVRRHPGIAPLDLEQHRGVGIGGQVSMRSATVPQLTLGSVALYNVRAGLVLASRGAFSDRFDAGNIGLGILRNFVITFDEPAGALYLLRGRDFDDGRFRPQYEPLGLPHVR